MVHYGIDDQSMFMDSGSPGENLGAILGTDLGVHTSWGSASLPVGEIGTVSISYASGFSLQMEVVRDDGISAHRIELDLDSPAGQKLISYTGDFPFLGTTFAGSLDDAILLSGDDTITGNDANNRLEGYGGSDTIFGGEGTDIAVYAGNHADFSVAGTVDNLEVIGKIDVDHLHSVERLQFDDGMLAFDFDGTAGEALRLYQAAFNRPPDLGGLGYQINDLDHHYSLVQVAANFIASPEFRATYGNVDDTQFLTLLYRNVLHRAPDPGGLQYHLNEIASGQSRALELVHFSESPENQAQVYGSESGGIFYYPYVG